MSFREGESVDEEAQRKEEIDLKEWESNYFMQTSHIRNTEMGMPLQASTLTQNVTGPTTP